MTETKIDEVSEPTKAPKKPVTKKLPKPQVVAGGHRYPRKVSFAVYASQKLIPSHHQGGMRAFVKNPDTPRTMETWEKEFEAY
jgi:hypothetical protein